MHIADHYLIRKISKLLNLTLLLWLHVSQQSTVLCSTLGQKTSVIWFSNLFTEATV